MAYTNKEDQKAYARRHYQENKAAYLQSSTVSRKKAFEDRRQRVRDYLATHPCVDCGETDPIVLEFDHIDSATKYLEISKMVRRRLRWERILAEIAKCEVRCANCHRRRTAIQFGWI